MSVSIQRALLSDAPEIPLDGLLQDHRFAKLYKGATDHWSGRTGTPITPYESKTTALYEDVYNHILFCGREYSNNSQQPPFIGSRKACDIVTRYWDPMGNERIFLFTEAKRDSVSGYDEAEAQLIGYLREHLKSEESLPVVFGSVVRGDEMGLFYMTKRDRQLVPLSDYIDIGGNDANIISSWARVMKAWVKSPKPTELLLDDFLHQPSSSSRLGSTPPTIRGRSTDSPHTPGSRGRVTNSPHTPVNPTFHLTSSSLALRPSPSLPPASPSRVPSRSPAFDHSPSNYRTSHVTSPSTSSSSSREPSRHEYARTTLRPGPSSALDVEPNPFTSSSRRPSPAPPSSRSNSRSPPSRDVRQRTPPRPRIDPALDFEATVAISKWGASIDDTEFFVRSRDGLFRDFYAKGSLWEPAVFIRRNGQEDRCYMVRDPGSRRVYTESIDPSRLGCVGPARNQNPPRWTGASGR